MKDERRKAEQPEVLVGIDVGSTTTKIVVMQTGNSDYKVVFSNYERHHADQLKSVLEILKKFDEKMPAQKVRVCLTGSGAKPIAESLGVPFAQEVAANAIALQKKYEKVGTAIELGGQDAKMIFFKESETDHMRSVSDMRMNGSCAGGTGAFIDEIASVLKVPVEEFNALAAKGEHVYDISGRCGVYAKTDIQPLLNQGAAKEDLALSAFHAIAKQTIGGLAQGLEIESPVAFEGGPLTFNPVLVRVFSERLQLEKEDILIPEHPELMIATGAALSLKEMFAGSKKVAVADILKKLEQIQQQKEEAKKNGTNISLENEEKARPFFASVEEKAAFEKEHEKKKITWKKPQKGEVVRGYLGIDAGSTTTKFVLLSDNEEILDSFYAPNEGDPLKVAKQALIDLRERYKEAGAELEILSAGTTGYGEMLFSKAFDIKNHTVETVAHARAAEKYIQDASFILDIGGQDMKAIWLENGVITNILLNEACSSGCGSFLENFASSLHIPTKEIAKTAFSSKNPAVLGSRCTVFMNSGIITEQRNGRTSEDIMAGLCRSIIENVFTKVIRVSNLDSLGKKIVVQGGTFENDAVLRAMEEYVGRDVVRAPYPGIMGAIGMALIAKEKYEKSPETEEIWDLQNLDTFSYTQDANSPCPFCGNHCNRTIVKFSNGNSWVTNNRCERGEVIGNPKDKEVNRQVKEKLQKVNAVPNLYKIREELLFKDYPHNLSNTYKNKHATEHVGENIKEHGKGSTKQRTEVIGLPRVLSYWDTMPFWKTFWQALGYTVRISDKSTRKMYEDGLSAVTSDTVCFPAKLVHGHIRNLVKHKVDRIFMPSVTTVPTENTEETSQSMCAVVKGYPIVIRNSDNPSEKWGVPYDAPLFHWYTKKDRQKQLVAYMSETFGITKEETLAAIKAGDAAQKSFDTELKKAGARKGFKKAITIMKKVRYDRTYLKQQVLIVGEYLLNFHPGANHDIEAYLEENGFEIIEARMTDVIRKTYFYQDAQIKEYHLNKPIDQKVWYRTADTIFDFAHKLTDSIAKEHPLYEPACRMDELVKDSDPIIHHTFDAGEGVLIPGEILHHAKHGCKFFLILQPFGCLPNHVVGRGITKKLKEIYPDVQILPLDYDPDVSFANIENRLQMLVMNAKQAKRRVSVVQKKENKKETVKKGKIHKQESYC